MIFLAKQNVQMGNVSVYFYHKIRLVDTFSELLFLELG